jgi:methyl-accepting chemotaxis protein
MVEPYLYPIDGVNVLMTSAVVPITMDGKFVGVAGVDLPLKSIQKETSEIKPYQTTNQNDICKFSKILTKHLT